MPILTPTAPIKCDAKLHVLGSSIAQDAKAAWAFYQKTGLHLTLDEVGDWMSTWGTASEKPVPTCHV
jgi:predicted transcriptional regulator